MKATSIYVAKGTCNNYVGLYKVLYLFVCFEVVVSHHDRYHLHVRPTYSIL